MPESASSRPRAGVGAIARKLMQDQAGVFVMNVYYTGIGIARNLRGLRSGVFGLSSEHDAPGVRSRFFRRIYSVPNGRDEPEALCNALLDIRKQHDEAPVIFPTRDADLVFLDEHAERLRAHYRLPPGGAARAKLMDKLQLASIAHELSIAVPGTRACDSAGDLVRVLKTLRMPVVIKPRSAHLWRRKGAWEAVGFRNAIFANSAEKALAEYRALSAVSAEVLVQEYVAGDDRDIVVCCCCIGTSGECLGYFTGRKLRQSPPLFGTGCLVEATAIPEIVEPSLRLLNACGYSGLAEIEFKRNAKTGEFFLIEVNPRHWDQHQLGELVGINVSRLAYEDTLGRPPKPVVPTYPPGANPRWIAEREAVMLSAQTASRAMAATKDGTADLALRIRIVRDAIADLRDVFRGPRVLGILDRRDPLPGMIFLARFVRELCVAAMRKMQRAS